MRVDPGLAYPLIVAGFITVIGLIGWIVKTLLATNVLLARHDVDIENIKDDIRELRA